MLRNTNPGQTYDLIFPAMQDQTVQQRADKHKCAFCPAAACFIPRKGVVPSVLPPNRTQSIKSTSNTILLETADLFFKSYKRKCYLHCTLYTHKNVIAHKSLNESWPLEDCSHYFKSDTLYVLDGLQHLSPIIIFIKLKLKRPVEF